MYASLLTNSSFSSCDNPDSSLMETCLEKDKNDDETFLSANDTTMGAFTSTFLDSEEECFTPRKPLAECSIDRNQNPTPFRFQLAKNAKGLGTIIEHFGKNKAKPVQYEGKGDEKPKNEDVFRVHKLNSDVLSMNPFWIHHDDMELRITDVHVLVGDMVYSSCLRPFR
mmetsp:Transcript_8869/g.11562  ORF Transcript_8869/g.11562 Transcript_8869/m.11562 type:complete len:168 (-) Transcript_8869:63-566(-)